MRKDKHSVAGEFLDDFIRFNKEQLLAVGLDSEQTEEVSRLIAQKMCDEWGGQIIYFPKYKRAGLSDRDLQIWKDFNGHNHRELARKYKMALQNIYRILDFVQRAETAKRQGALDL